MKSSFTICLLALLMVIPAQAIGFADFSDDRILVGCSHDVFVAKVIKKIGNSPIDHPMPHTRFQIEVVLNIKGTVGGQLLLDQAGGYRGNVFYPNRGDVIAPGDKEEGLLEVGATYVFATRSRAVNPENIYHLISHPNGHALISRDAKSTLGQLREISSKSPRVIELKKAYQNEKIPDDFQKDARNRYQSSPEIR